MVESQTVEGRIAKFLGENNISIFSDTTDDYEILTFVQYRDGGTVEGSSINFAERGASPVVTKPIEGRTRILSEMVNLGQRKYRIGSGELHPVSVEEIQKGEYIKGFSTEVIEPMSFLLQQVGGNFYDMKVSPVHEACNMVEGRQRLLKHQQ